MTDPVTTAVVGSVLNAIVGEMNEALKRSSYSPIIREMLDFSCALFSSDGETIAQDENIPALLGSMAYALPALLEDNADEPIRPGDMFIGNNPYRGGTHTPDIHIFAPIFHEGTIVAWAGNLAHHTDVGGTNPGTEGFANQSIFEEGVIYPYVKLMEQERLNRTILRIMETNVRDPQTNLGDLRAQIAAARLGVRRFGELIDKYGTERIGEVVRQRLSQGEARIRRKLSDCPDGRASATGYLDNDGLGGPPQKIQVTVEVRGDELHVDFTGTDPQMPGGMNCSHTAALAAIIFGVKAVIDPDGEQTAGCVRPIRTNLPTGTLVNPDYPAAVSLRHLASQRITDTLIRALSQIYPAVNVAGSFVGFSSLAAEGRDPHTGRTVVMADDLGGGMGGYSGGDGLDTVDTYLGNVGILPAEICERQYPIRIVSTELMPDSGGAGEFRGGLGMRRVYEFLDHCDVVFYTEQTNPKYAPWGRERGHVGEPASLTLVRRDGDRRTITKDRILVDPGDRMVTITGGGGGYGDPKRRRRDAVLRDLREGKISREAAIEVYGMVPDQAARR
ncbi:MAG: hydantoinase B/oxoprolinase family protein [Gammaproteobacteria bacterium]|nr:hydantoinase B/oxoprolinase family protein [Gammaproteobacteria bacterium]